MNSDLLERNIKIAIADDEKYDRENKAKIRAVEQRVGSYDEFRELVLGCHLRPIPKKETINSPCKEEVRNKNVRASQEMERTVTEINKFLPTRKNK